MSLLNFFAYLGIEWVRERDEEGKKYIGLFHKEYRVSKASVYFPVRIFDTTLVWFHHIHPSIQIQPTNIISSCRRRAPPASSGLWEYSYLGTGSYVYMLLCVKFFWFWSNLSLRIKYKLGDWRADIWTPRPIQLLNNSRYRLPRDKW